MPILNSILEAEQKADKIRQEAEEQVRILLEKTKAQSEKAAQNMLSEFAKKEILDEQVTKQTVADLEKATIARNDALDQSIAKQAKERSDVAIEMIVKKVLKP